MSTKRSGYIASVLRSQLLYLGLALTGSIALASCGPPRIDDPLETMRDINVGPNVHRAAMQQLDTEPDNEAYKEALSRMMWAPGFTIPIRLEALDRLSRSDLELCQRTLRLHLPRTDSLQWLEAQCEEIAKRDWKELSPALVSSWARVSGIMTDEQRPEYLALVKLHGKENVTDAVFTMFLESRSVAEQGLRTRCWALLIRLGQRDRLVQLMRSADVPADDLMLIDLRAAADDFGIVPVNREEILWIRKLRMPEYAAFWSEAKAAIGDVLPEARSDLQLRDLAIIVSAARHEPEVLRTTRDDLYTSVETYVRSQKRHESQSFAGVAGDWPQQLQQFRKTLTWSDLAAMRIAIRALQVPELRDHLFNYAERDMKDTTTEYGGILDLDAQGRFQLVEFPPKIRKHDLEFNAPQAMFDAAYTALFHFHYHTQKYDNSPYAGPGLGDVNYADNSRANCLVFTFINKNTLNVDYYRHGRVMVDLGEVKRN